MSAQQNRKHLSSERKLAAILFADIVGYTSLMQRGESKAMSILNRYQEVTAEKVQEYHGEIIKTYGDGSLILFDSTVDAVRCAYDMQVAYREETEVPVRIGIHVGEVVRKKNDVFGNGVNIASRVESMGIAGAVLMSADVHKRIKNQEDLSTLSLGYFEFKNVEEPIEVFALTNEGFAVPKKQEMKGKFKEKKETSPLKWLIPAIIGLIIVAGIWIWKGQNDQSLSLDGVSMLESPRTPLSSEVRKKSVAVMVFENQTMDPNMDVLGLMASDFITQGLIEHSNAKVVSAANRNNNVQLASIGRAELASETGAEVIIQGRYYLRENYLLLHSNIVDAQSGEVIHALQPIEGSKSDPMSILDELQQELLGYWVLKDEKWIGKNPPKFNAYQEYLSAIQTWQTDYTNTERHLIRAIELDSTFYRALLKLSVNYINAREKDKARETLKYLSTKESYLTKFENMRLRGVRSTLVGNRKGFLDAAEVYYKMYEEFNAFGVNAVQNYCWLNMPQKCIETFDRFYDFDWVDGDGGRQRCNYYADYLTSHNLIGQYDKSVSLMDSINVEPTFFPLAFAHLRALARLKRIDELDRHLNKYVDLNLLGFNEKPIHPSWLYERVCSEFYLMDEKDLLDKYLALSPPASDHPEDFFMPVFAEYNMSYYSGDFEKTLKDYKKRLEQNNSYGNLIVLLSKSNKKQEAEEFWVTLQSMDAAPDDLGLLSYQKGIAAVAMGDKALATEYLTEAFEDGFGIREGRYKNDYRLKDLFGFPPFEEFIKPKG